MLEQNNCKILQHAALTEQIRNIGRKLKKIVNTCTYVVCTYLFIYVPKRKMKLKEQHLLCSTLMYICTYIFHFYLQIALRNNVHATKERTCNKIHEVKKERKIKCTFCADHEKERCENMQHCTASTNVKHTLALASRNSHSLTHTLYHSPNHSFILFYTSFVAWKRTAIK